MDIGVTKMLVKKNNKKIILKLTLHLALLCIIFVPSVFSQSSKKISLKKSSASNIGSLVVGAKSGETIYSSNDFLLDTPRSSDQPLVTIPLNILLSNDFYANRDLMDVTAQIGSLVSVANYHYHKFGIIFQVDEVKLLDTINDPVSNSNDSREIWNKTALLAKDMNLKGKILILLTNKSLGFHRGISHVGSICENLPIAVVSQPGSFNFLQLPLNVSFAHEIGHILGLTHDSAESDTIMSQVNHGYATGFSEKSNLEIINTVLKGKLDCFDKLNPPVVSSTKLNINLKHGGKKSKQFEVRLRSGLNNSFFINPVGSSRLKLLSSNGLFYTLSNPSRGIRLDRWSGALTIQRSILKKRRSINLNLVVDSVLGRESFKLKLSSK